MASMTAHVNGVNIISAAFLAAVPSCRPRPPTRATPRPRWHAAWPARWGY